VDQIRRHYELLVEDLEVARCEQTMALTEAEGGECGAAERRQRSGRNWTGASANVEQKRSAGGGGKPI
jgi:hypothetical protein